jgi:hypothetical protein
MTTPDWNVDTIDLTDEVEMEPFGQELYEALAPMTYADKENAWALAHYVRAIALMFEDIEDLVRRSEWGDIMDADTIWPEGLPWLGQFVGVRVLGPYSEEEQRQRVHDKAGWRRGQIKAIEDAIKPFLTGNKTVNIYERQPGGVDAAYHIIVETLDHETPVSDDEIIRAITLAKPAGIMFDFASVTGQVWINVELGHPNWADARDSAP